MAERRPDRTLGHNHSLFWDWCAKDELRLQRCETCDHLAWPAVRRCDACGGEDFTWERMSGQGRVISWTSFERDYYGGMLPMPWDTILVELAEGPLFLSNPAGFTCRDLSPGLPVTVAFIDAEDSAGRFRLPVFERAGVDR